MRAIIIGAGIGGLTAAAALRRRGIEAEVYEKNSELREVGAGISLWSNAVKALRKLGLGEVLDSISLVNKEGCVRRWNGTFLSRTPAHDLERRFGGGVIVLHRAELLDMLARSVGAAQIHLGCACTGIDHGEVRQWLDGAGRRAHRRGRIAFGGAKLAGARWSDALFRLHGLARRRSLRWFRDRNGRDLGARQALRPDAGSGWPRVLVLHE